ncbi:MAG: metallophosphoesterase [Zavarzinella sp.]
MYDIIGDLHGHGDELERLLHLLGYSQVRGVYQHPERKVIFLGDWIDRGPKIKKVLEIVRPMVLENRALAILGNHEWNALAFHTEHPHQAGEFLRPHHEKNVRQHSGTLEQLSPTELNLYLDWFRTVPLWLDLPELRAIHACWDNDERSKIEALWSPQRVIHHELLVRGSDQQDPIFAAIEVLLKGKEVRLPGEYHIIDKDGIRRKRTRTRWYLSPHGLTYQQYLWDRADCTELLPAELVTIAQPYPEDAPPVFVGHYWQFAPTPSVLAPNVACLDYSVAKGGFACSYRWGGEKVLLNDNFVILQ